MREAQADDAPAMIRYAQVLFAEPGLDLPTSPGEFTLTVEQEEAVVAEYAAAGNCVFLLAMAREGEIVGMLNCRGSSRRALRHSCVMGISVAREHRGAGIGTALMQSMLNWASASGIKRIELNVYARNQRAIRLYRSFGFQAEGRRRAAVFQDGEHLDDIVMSLLL